jgi:hypothetical protein
LKDLEMKKTKSAASKSKTPSANKLPQELCRANEAEALYEEDESGMMIVLGKFQVTQMFYYLVAHQIECIVSILVPEEEYTPAEIIGDEDWFGFGPEAQRAMTLCLKHITAHPDSDLTETDTGTFMLA